MTELARKANYLWRLFWTGLSFLLFGAGAFLHALFVFACRFFVRNKEKRFALQQRVLGRLLNLFRSFIQLGGLVSIRVEGLERIVAGKSYLILVNHPTLIDALILLTIFPEALCIVKSEVGTHWMYRTVCDELGFLILGDSTRLIESAVDALAAGRSVLLFPEGTRSPSNALRPFERGAATIFLRSLVSSGPDVEILPITISCSPPTLARGQRWYEIPDRHIDFRVTIKYPFQSENVLKLAKQNYLHDRSSTENEDKAEQDSESSSAVLEVLRASDGLNSAAAKSDGVTSEGGASSRTASVELTHFLQSYFEEQLTNERTH